MILWALDELINIFMVLNEYDSLLSIGTLSCLRNSGLTWSVNQVCVRCPEFAKFVPHPLQKGSLGRKNSGTSKARTVPRMKVAN